MQTRLAGFIEGTEQGQEAEEILRACVHCGFCNATCPTYQVLADEQDGPRGRIYLMKQLLEGEAAGPDTRLHLDRCLTCRACETTCPSGVRYGRLLEIGRAVTEERVPRPLSERLGRQVLAGVLARRALVSPALALARLAAPVLPRTLRRRIPTRSRLVPRHLAAALSRARTAPWPAPRHRQSALFLTGCVQGVLEPGIDRAAARLLDRIGISAVRVPATGCCGALSLHLSQEEAAAAQARRNIDAWWPHIDAATHGATDAARDNSRVGIALTASACALMVRDYGQLLKHDPRYAARAAEVSECAQDVSALVAAHSEPLAAALSGALGAGTRVAFHAPCTLQHGLKTRQVVEPLLRLAGFTLTQVPDSHLCCGSAGTYSLLQPELSAQLLKRKVAALESDAPALIASANIGCITSLRSATRLPVMHWVELLAAQL